MFHKVNGETLADKMAKRMIDALEGGSFEPGDYLPSEHSLCEQFEVSRTTVRAALMILAQQGYIKTGRGKGSMVIERPAKALPVQYEDAKRTLLILALGAAVRVADGLTERAICALEEQHKRCVNAGDGELYEELLSFRMLLVSFCQSEPLDRLAREMAAICLQGPAPDRAALVQALEAQEGVIAALREGAVDAAVRAVQDSAV